MLSSENNQKKLRRNDCPKPHVHNTMKDGGGKSDRLVFVAQIASLIEAGYR
jgi:hypothetical protein